MNIFVALTQFHYYHNRFYYQKVSEVFKHLFTKIKIVIVRITTIQTILRSSLIFRSTASADLQKIGISEYSLRH
jgi:hypothetical protein